MLLLHPFCLDGGIFADLTARLAPCHRVVALDLRGHGGSAAPPAPYTMAMLAGDVIGALDALGLARAHLVGAALGGCVALHVAGLAPERLLSLTVAGAHLATPPETGPVWDGRIATVRREGVAALAAMTLDRWLGPLAAETPPALVEALRARILAMRPEGYVGAAEALKAHDARPLLAAVRCPALVIAGDMDPAAPPERGREIAAALPDARLQVIARCGHIVPAQRPDAFAAAVGGFLAQAASG